MVTFSLMKHHRVVRITFGEQLQCIQKSNTGTESCNLVKEIRSFSVSNYLSRPQAMSWTSLDEDGATSSSDAEDLVEADNLQNHITKQSGRRIDAELRRPGPGDGSQIGRSSSSYLSQDQDQSSPCNPFVQEPNSDNEINSGKEISPQIKELKNLLASKDELIRTLQKLINGQREQLYHFLNMSLKGETLLELKKTCRETEAINRNENISMALDKFKYDNGLPTEQTLVREDVSRTLLKIERLMRHQTRLVKSLESGEVLEGFEDVDESIALSCYQRNAQLTDPQKLLKGTEQIQQRIEILRIQLKKLALIEQERIDLVERVYSMPSDQRQYYAHLASIEREKVQLRSEINKLSESHRDLKQKCCFLEETEQELNKCIDSKISGLDLNKIKPGLETHLELMEMVERGELSLITMTKDEKGRLTGDFVKLYNENSEMSERLKDFDKVTEERNELKREIEVLVENCLRLQGEVKALRLASKTDDLLEQLRLACLEREQLRTRLERFTKNGGPGVQETSAEERDQLKFADHLTVEEDLESLRFEANRSEAYRVEVESLKGVIAELEEAKARSGKNPDVVNNPHERNMPKELERMKELETQIEILVLEISRYRYALLRQEEEIRELVITVDKLLRQTKIPKINPGVNPAEGIPEGPEITPALSSEDEKRLEMIRNRIREDCPKTKIQNSVQSDCISNPEKSTFIDSFKSFLGLDNLLRKTID